MKQMNLIFILLASLFGACEKPDTTVPTNPAVSGFDNISGFTPAMIFSSLQPNVTSVRQFRDRLRVLHLGSTPNTAGAYNTFVDIYDVFN